MSVRRKSFFGICRIRANYSGVVTFCKKDVPVIAAEEGLSGRGTERGLPSTDGIQRPPSSAWNR